MELNTYHFLLFLHLIFLIIGFGSVVVIDFCGILWLINKIRLTFISKVAKITQPLIWLGWSGLVLSGIPLLAIKGFINSITILKIFAVLMLGLNGIYLHIIKKTFKKYENQSHISKILSFRITLATFTSQICWWTAITVGFLNNKLKDKAPIIENPYFYIKAFLITVIVIFLAGEIFIGNSKMKRD